MDINNAFPDLKNSLQELSDLIQKHNDTVVELARKVVQIQELVLTAPTVKQEVNSDTTEERINEENGALRVEASSSSTQLDFPPSFSGDINPSSICSTVINDSEVGNGTDDEDDVLLIHDEDDNRYSSPPKKIKKEGLALPSPQQHVTREPTPQLAFEPGEVPFLAREQKFREAAERGNIHLIKELYKVGVNPNSSDRHTKQNALHLAVGHERCLSELLNICDFKTMNAKDWMGCSPLHWACIKESPECIELLSKKNVYMNTKDKNGDTPLHHAAKMNNLRCVTQLLKSQGIRKKEKNPVNGYIAADYTSIDSIKLLLK